ncbi:butyrophilin subfamily 1 member A1-like [Lepisosteus oculatus]|uniref:butyrophilin subfamily 1 member A1-like n=1 Tax=Lepisosteus oculatus TaxID=7918 RepID=UPI003715ACEB
MMPPRLQMVLILYLPLLSRSDSGQFSLLVPSDPVDAIVGTDVILPCQLAPSQDISSAQMRWSRVESDSTVIMVKEGVESGGLGGRATLSHGGEGLTVGHVSLKISRVHVSDEGTYVCFVRTSSYYSQEYLVLKVTAVGSQPVISLTEPPDSWSFSLDCSVSGWYPLPQLSWSDPHRQDWTFSAETETTQDEQGLYSVSSHLQFPRQKDRQSVRCTLFLEHTGASDHTEILFTGAVFPVLLPWRVAVALLALLLVAAVGLSTGLLWMSREERRKRKEARDECLWLREEFDAGKLIPKTEWSAIQDCAVDVRLDPDTAHPGLSIRGQGWKVRRWEARRKLPPSETRFTEHPFVAGMEGFPAGRHYWEVELGEKPYWDVGVAQESFPRNRRVPLTPREGLFALGLRDRNELWALTDPRTRIPPEEIPRRMGVFLDHERGVLSFYNVENRNLIFKFEEKFCGNLYPVFSPGHDPADLVICKLGGAATVQTTLTQEALSALREDLVDVKLDPSTAHSNLDVSLDGKCVHFLEETRRHSVNTYRFMEYPFVLATEGFTSGTHYWEVDVGDLQYWDIGVAKESVERTRRIPLIRSEGIWALGLRDGQEFWALTDPRSSLPINQIPRKMGVVLDYDAGILSFYNLESLKLIFSFEDRFSGRLYPLFCPGLRGGPDLVILEHVRSSHRQEECQGKENRPLLS